MFEKIESYSSLLKHIYFSEIVNNLLVAKLFHHKFMTKLFISFRIFKLSVDIMKFIKMIKCPF